MRLLNVSTLKLETFVGTVPHYVILSHTWGPGEVTFDDFDKDYAKYMPGYHKVIKSCEQAIEDGFDYVWIDTCCIDKKSSAELSENINSMWKYYRDAQICYAFLEDVLGQGHSHEIDSEFVQSRWFTRGWTLQELLAPEIVEFYTKDWVMIGTKKSLIASVVQATGIHEGYLWLPDRVRMASTARIFSWASRRKTTREEDIAYCLMGLLDVNMPLIYGEGKKAFVRLQAELIKQTDDETFLCWKDETGDVGVHGPFCDSPAAFASSGDILAGGGVNPAMRKSHWMTNKGLDITLPCIDTSTGTPKDSRILALLDCRISRSHVGIWLSKVLRSEHQYARDVRGGWTPVSPEAAKRAKPMNLYIQGFEHGQIANNASLEDPFRFKATSTRAKFTFANIPEDLRYGIEDIVKAKFRRRGGLSQLDESRYSVASLEIGDNEIMGVLLRGNVSVLISFSLFQGSVGFWIGPNVPSNRMLVELMKAYQGSPWGSTGKGCDYLVQTYGAEVTNTPGENVKLVLKAKKKRDKDTNFLVWHINLEVKTWNVSEMEVIPSASLESDDISQNNPTSGH